MVVNLPGTTTSLPGNQQLQVKRAGVRYPFFYVLLQVTANHIAPTMTPELLHTRRSLLRIGSLGTLGLSLPGLLRGAESGRTAAAKSCVLFFLEGGPATQDMWDLKPNSPLEYRGETVPIDSSLPGVPVCENLPMLSRHMHRIALVHGVHHTINDHNAGAYYALTGRSPLAGGRLIVRDEPENFPRMGPYCRSCALTADCLNSCICRRSCRTTATTSPVNGPAFWEPPATPSSRAIPAIRSTRCPVLRSLRKARGPV